MKLLKNLLSIGVFMISLFSFTFSQDVTLSLDGGNLDYSSTADIAGFNLLMDVLQVHQEVMPQQMVLLFLQVVNSTCFSFTGSVVPAGKEHC